MPIMRGGVHPDDQKTATRYKSIQPLSAPSRLIFPLLMHIGAPAKPLVDVGDTVYAGQKIAESGGPVSAAVHSSVSGVVWALESRPHPSGAKSPAIVIDSDGKNTLDPKISPCGSVGSLTGEQLIGIARDAGLVGLGGAAFPTHFKLSSSVGKVDVLVLNGSECEPYITSDHRVMLESPEEVIGGVRALMKILALSSAVIAVESNKADAADALRRTLPRGGGGITVRLLPARFPQGSEKHLIYSVAGRKVPPGALPASVGAAVFNVQTAAALHRAVTTGVPLIRRVVTVSGSAVSNPQNFLVPIGTPIGALFEATGGFRERPEKIIAGGPLMGVAQHTMDVPVIKATGGLLAFGAKEAQIASPGPCLRCGKCLSACPMRLTPCLMYQAERTGRLDECERLNVRDCVECGCCSYICPARLHLVQSFRAAKTRILAAKSGGGGTRG